MRWERKTSPMQPGREGNASNKNGCGTTHTGKNKTKCPHLKLGYIKTHYLAVAIFKLRLQQTFVQLNVTGQEVYSGLSSWSMRSLQLWKKWPKKRPSSPGWQVCALCLPPRSDKHWGSSATVHIWTLLRKGPNPLGNTLIAVTEITQTQNPLSGFLSSLIHCETIALLEFLPC